MEEKKQPKTAEHCIPIYIKLLWGILAIWAFIYLANYMLPDFGQWVSSTDPDKTQWNSVREREIGRPL